MTRSARPHRMWNLIWVSLLLTMALLPALPAPAVAGAGATTAAAMGMAGAYAAVARDYEAAHLNPANLALAGNAGTSLHILSFSGESDNSSLTIDDYQRFNGATLNEDDKAYIMGQIEGEQLTFDVSGDLAGLSLTSGGIALTVANAAVARGGLPRDLIELMLYGNELGRSYDIGNASGEGIAVSSLGISGSRALSLPMVREVVDEFAVGGTFHYKRGWYYGRVVDAYGSLETQLDGLHGTGAITVRSSTSGSGMGIDFGLAARRGGLGLSLSFHNLASRMTWKNGEDLITSFSADSVTAEQLEEGGDLVEQTDETVAIGDFEIDLPASVRLGAALDLGSLLVAADYVQGWGGDGLQADSAELATGVEHRTTGWLRLRGGFALGPDRSPGLSLGGGLHAGAARIDLAVASKGGLLLSQDEGIGVALGLGLVF